MTTLIDQLPLPVPSRTDPANFSVRADNFLGELPDFATQINALATELNAIGTQVEANKTAAQTAETNAQASAFAAAGSANNAALNTGAALWVSGNSYSGGALVYSPLTSRTYRRKVAGAGTTDPSLDATNWAPVILEVTTGYPTCKPSLNLDFANSKVLDSRITFLRNSTATYYDGKTQHKAEENLFTYSEEFDNAIWTKFNTTVTANATTDPFGLATAETLVESATTNWHGLYQLFPCVVGNQYTLSVYAKYNNRQFLQLSFSTTGFNSTHYANFDIQGGTVGTVGAGATASISSVGNGWYRCSITCNPVSSQSGSAGKITIVTASNAAFDQSYAGSTSNSVIIFGAQMEVRSSVGAYVKTQGYPVTKYVSTLLTAPADTPRFDHDPITRESKGLLFEEAQVNQITYSEDFSNAAWIKSGVSIGTATGLLECAPDGTLSAQRLIETASNTTHLMYRSFTPSSGVTYTFSVYLKAFQRRYAWLTLSFTGGGRFGFDLINGTLTTGTIPSSQARIEHVGNGWYRCSIWVTATSTAAGEIQIGLDGDADPVSSITYVGDGYSGIWAWGAQFEDAAKFPSSYIKTTASLVTRQGDYAAITGTNFSSWFNQDEGAFVVDFTPRQEMLPSYYSNYIFVVSNTLDAERLDCRLRADNSKLGFVAVHNGVTSAASVGASYVLGNNYRAAVSFNNTSYSYAFSTGNYEEDLNVQAVTGSTRLVLGSYSQNSASARGWIKRLVFYPRSLSQSEMLSVTY